MNSTLFNVLSSLLLGSVAIVACDSDPSVPTEAGENDENDPDAPEDDPKVSEAPPANWSTLNTSAAPSELSIYANGAETNSGTGATLKLTYINKAGTYACTVAGVPSGTTRTCTPSKTSDSASSDYDRFYLAFATSSNTDGLRFSTIGVTVGGSSYVMEDFYYVDNSDNTNYSAMDCTGCSWWNCGSCYLDGDNHTDCINVLLPMKVGEPIDCKNFR